MLQHQVSRALRLAWIFFACSPAAAVWAQQTERMSPPLDDITNRQVIEERKPLAYAPVREADIVWEKRIWRVIDTREKMNQHFVAPQSPLFQVLSDAAISGELIAYSTETDDFSIPLDTSEFRRLITRIDTVPLIDIETMEETWQIVVNDIDWENVKRFRIKEMWWFDANAGAMRCRILGIAPLIEEYDDEGNFKFERPLFWVHVPSSRDVLNRHKAILSDESTTVFTWDDALEQRRFASYVYKESNPQDRRLSEYLAGTDLLLESQKINDELFNREHDFWSW